MKLNGSDLLLECLLEQGVDTIFGYPGGAVLNIYDALYKYSDKINHVITAHEQAACHAADGYARTTGKTGVVLATSGPGATNLVTGIATANMDSVPLVAITGNVGTASLGLDSFQEVDICGITMPITKHNFIVKDITKLADTVREAFYIANEGRKCPVLIDIPKDITAQLCEYTYKKPRVVVNHNPDDINAQIDAAAEMIKSSERPFIYAGGGVVSCNAQEELKELAEKIDSPISLSFMGQTAFNNKDKRYIGMLGMHGTKTASLTFGECDLMIALGTRFSDRVALNTNTFAKHTKVVHIDIDPAEIGKNVTADCCVNGDLKYILSRLNEILPEAKHSEWNQRISEWKSEYDKPMQPITDADEVLPDQVLKTLCALAGEDAIITTEVGQHQMWTAQYYDFVKPRTFASSGGLGTMGYGLGAAIGAKLGNPDKLVVNVAGDGSFFMNCNELSTLAKHGIPIVELVFENNVLGMVRQWQRIFYDKRFSQTTIDRGTDMMKLAQGFGIEGVRISKKSEIESGLKYALECGRPCLVECVIDKDVNVLPMVVPGGDVLKPIMEISLD